MSLFFSEHIGQDRGLKATLFIVFYSRKSILRLLLNLYYHPRSYCFGAVISTLSCLAAVLAQ